MVALILLAAVSVLLPLHLLGCWIFILDSLFVGFLFRFLIWFYGCFRYGFLGCWWLFFGWLMLIWWLVFFFGSWWWFFEALVVTGGGFDGCVLNGWWWFWWLLGVLVDDGGWWNGITMGIFLQWLGVAGYVVAGGGRFIFAIFRSQHLPNTCKYFSVKYLHVKYFTFENILHRNKWSVCCNFFFLGEACFYDFMSHQ